MRIRASREGDQPRLALLDAVRAECGGLLDAVLATDCPPLLTYRFDFGSFTLAGTPPPCDGGSVGYAPRRYLFDSILVEAAVASGAELRETLFVQDVLVEAVGAEQCLGKPKLEYGFYSY